MRTATLAHCTALVLVALAGGTARSAEKAPADLAARARAVLKTHCHRCHGRQGSLEGGMNYILDRDKLIARKKIVPGKAEQSPLFRRVAAGKMPPPDERPRPGPADVALLKQWIEAGAPPARPPVPRPLVAEADVCDRILADLDKVEKRARRFTRYFSLAPLANAGHGPDELQSYRNALAKLLNSLSWHPRITLPHSIDPDGLVLRIDLRDYLWDSGLWNRLLADYPYGVLQDTAVARAVLVATGTRMPVVRADWFVATASRAPLYYDLLQIPTNSSELERQLRVDVALDVQQERVARAGFNGSGISRNNRILERHDAQNGAYWRTYDFNAVPQNLTERDTLLPDRRNIFAYPLGPGLTENTFQHAGGEVIFNLPNGLQGYLLVNANNQRIDRAPTAIVSDPRRPDRAVEAGVSCINCHAQGIIPKDDQVRDHVAKNPRAFRRADADLIRALYVPKEKTRKLMEEDAERFRKAVEKTGNKVGSAEVVMAMTLRYEADVDLPTLAAEVGLRPQDLLPRLLRSEALAKNLGALKVPGATVARQVVVQSFGDVVRALRLGGVFQPGSGGESLPDNTGEVDPLEAQSSPANAAAFRPDGQVAAFASGDKSVRLWDVDAGRELRRCIGHTASVWCVAFSPDGTRLLSGSKDGTVRLWDAETGRELRRLDGHADLVTAVAFDPDGRRALSAGFDHEVILWDLEKGEAVAGFAYPAGNQYLNHVAFAPDGKQALVCAGRVIELIDARTGKVLRRLEGHGGWVSAAAFSPDGKRVLSGSDDRTLRLWDATTGKELRVLKGHEGGVRSVAFGPDVLLSGGADATVRLWDADSGKELRVFRKHTEALAGVTFLADGRHTLSAGRDAVVHLWRLQKAAPPVAPTQQPAPAPKPPARPTETLRPVAVIPVGGTVASLHLSPDRSALYFLNRTEGQVGRVDTRTGRCDHLLRLDGGADVLAISRDGKYLAALAPPPPPRGDGPEPGCQIQLIDPAGLKLRKTFVGPAAYDLAVSDSGLAYLSGGTGEWTDITALDLNGGKLVARWGGVWARSFLQLSGDQRRLYYSSQGVTPGTLEALVLPARPDEKPLTYRAPAPGRHALGGDFVQSPDGRYLLCKTGTVLRQSATRDEDLKFHAAVGPFLAAAFDNHATFLLTADGNLKRYSYPEFKLQGTYRLGFAAYQVACDGKHGRLYVAGFDPKAVSEHPRARGHGDIRVYALKDLSGK